MNKILHLHLILFLLSTTLFSQQPTISQRLGDLETPRLIKVACIGNSVTYGYGHENPDSTSYPSQLAIMLGDDYEVGNFGKSGATLLRKGHRPYNEQEEFQKALEFAPDIAIIHLGLNDTDPRNWKYYKQEFIADYVALIEAFEKVNPDVEIYICRMTPIFHWHHRFKKGTRDWYWEIQATIENIAENIAEVKLIDLQETLYHHPDLMPDALHPTPDGAKLIAQRVYSAITGNFGGLSLPKIYGDNMVLQRDKPFVVHGFANAGDKISVCFNKKTIVTETDENGKWQVTFDTLRVDGKVHTLTVEVDADMDAFNASLHVHGNCKDALNASIHAPDDRIKFKNIVVGEVILCSGNIESTDNGQQSTDFVENQIRFYDTKTGEWKSGVSYHSELYNIGSKIYDSLQVPIALIYNDIENAPIESFIDRKTLEWHPTLIDVLYEWRNTDNVKEYLDTNEPSYNFDKYIKPLTSFTIGSVIWFNGDSDTDLDSIKKLALIESWKKVFGDVEFMKVKNY